jgi:hypothetical protein
MKKLIFVALAVVFAAGFIAEAAIADERLSLSGSMRVRGWIKDDFDFDGNSDDDERFWDQRFRVGATIQAAEGVSGHLRFDFAEDFWGSDNWGGSRFDESSELQVDRAYLQIDKEMFTFRAGQQYLGLGQSIVYDNNGTGLMLQLKLPVLVTLGFTKEDEGGSKVDQAATDDVDHYFAQVSWASDMFGVDAYYAKQTDGKPTDVEPHAFGAVVKANLGMFNVLVEGTIFGGDDAAGTDFIGTQFWGEVSANVTEQLKVGVDLIYAKGTDDPNEDQLTFLTDFGSFVLEDRGPFQTDISSLGADTVFDVGSVGAALGGTDHQGSLGAGIFADFAVMDGLMLQGQYMYLKAQEDNIAIGQIVDSISLFNIGAEYEIAPKATVAAQYHYLDPDLDGAAGVDSDAATAIVWRFQIKF